MARVVVIAAALLMGATAAWADTLQDCQQLRDADLAIRACGELIKGKPKDAGPYATRGIAYLAKGDRDHAIADFTKAIELNPKECQRLQQSRLDLPADGQASTGAARRAACARIGAEERGAPTRAVTSMRLWVRRRRRLLTIARH